MTLKTYNGSSFETVPYRYYDGSNWRGTPLYRYNGTEWVDAYQNNSLAVYYPFDGDIQDYSGNNNDATDNTSAGFGTGRIGSGSKSFDGTDDYLSVPDLNLQKSNAFTISAWALKTSNADSCIVGRRSGSNDRLQMLWRYDTANKNIQVILGNSDNDTHKLTHPNNQEGAWLHAAFTYDPAPETKLYVNGTLEDTDTSAISEFATTSGPDIARRSGDGALNFPGYIDAFRVYDKALSSAEIDHLYQHGRVI